jgi:hypothetical protein
MDYVYLHPDQEFNENGLHYWRDVIYPRRCNLIDSWPGWT